MQAGITVQDICKSFPGRQGKKEAVLKGISFSIQTGETFALIGPSGSGKSTIAKILAGLLPQDKGIINIEKPIGFVSQDPYTSLSPLLTVEHIVAEPLRFSKKIPQNRCQKLVSAALESVHIDYAHYGKRRASELSGGERQRVAIARAIVAQPPTLILDEPTSMLDYTTKFEIIRILAELPQKIKPAILLISHDIALVKTLCSVIAILQDGQIIESGDTKDIIEDPKKSLTKKLILASSDLKKYWDMEPCAL